MNFIMIGLLLREALDRLRVRLNMYLVFIYSQKLNRRVNNCVVLVEIHVRVCAVCG